MSDWADKVAEKIRLAQREFKLALADWEIRKSQHTNNYRANVVTPKQFMRENPKPKEPDIAQIIRSALSEIKGRVEPEIIGYQFQYPNGRWSATFETKKTAYDLSPDGTDKIYPVLRGAPIALKDGQDGK